MGFICRGEYQLKAFARHRIRRSRVETQWHSDSNQCLQMLGVSNPYNQYNYHTSSMIHLHHPHIRPQSAQIPYNPLQSRPVPIGVRSSTNLPLTNSLLNIPGYSTPRNASSGVFSFPNINNSLLTKGEPLASISRIRTQTSISDTIPENGIVLLNVTAEYSTSGSIMKKPYEIIKQKQVSFQKGLEQLNSVRQHLRETKTAIRHILPMIDQEAGEISEEVEKEFRNGIPDRSRILFHLFYEKQYESMLKTLQQYMLDTRISIDIMRKRNNITKQEFEDILKIANDSATYVKTLIADFPTMGWKSTNNKMSLQDIVAKAETELDLIQKLRILQSNINNKHYYYKQKPSFLNVSVAKPLRAQEIPPVIPAEKERSATPSQR